MTRARAHRAALAASLLLLGACAATGPTRTAPTAAAAPAAVPDNARPPDAPSQESASAAPLDLSDATPASLWRRLAQRFAMPKCDDSPLALRWAKTYTAGKVQFAANVRRALPLLMLVDAEVEQRDLPGEFVLLPYLESDYEPIATQGDRPAGMWQIVPDTARLKGLAVGRDYDGRLDATASTNAALDLLEDYQREFGDWRLADMAFNAGEYRVRKLIGARPAAPLDTDALATLKLSPITHEHLAKLRALACVVADPGRFGVALPEPGEADRLVVVPLEVPMDLRVAAHLAGVDLATLRRYNAGYRTTRMPASAPHRLLLPAPRADAFASAARAIPPALWSDWREIALRQAASLDTLAGEQRVDAAVLAAANGRAGDVGLAAGTRVLVPGVEARRTESAGASEGAAVGARADATHVVRRGETLSGIAQQYGVRVAELLRWNDLGPRATLHPGDRLKLGLGDGQ